MNIFALIATSSLNYFAIKPNQTKVSVVLIVIMTLNGYSPLSLPFPKTPKDHLPRLGEAPLVVHALPQVVAPAIHSSPGLTRKFFQKTNSCLPLLRPVPAKVGVRGGKGELCVMRFWNNDVLQIFITPFIPLVSRGKLFEKLNHYTCKER